MWSIDLKSRLDLIYTVEISDLAELKIIQIQQGLIQKHIFIHEFCKRTSKKTIWFSAIGEEEDDTTTRNKRGQPLNIEHAI